MIAAIPPVQAPAAMFQRAAREWPASEAARRFHDATTTVVCLSNHLRAYRAAAGDKAIVAALTVDDQLRTVQLDAPFGNRLQATSPPADPAVLEVPSHGWEVAF